MTERELDLWQVQTQLLALFILYPILPIAIVFDVVLLVGTLADLTISKS